MSSILENEIEKWSSMVCIVLYKRIFNHKNEKTARLSSFMIKSLFKKEFYKILRYHSGKKKVKKYSTYKCIRHGSNEPVFRHLALPM